MDNTINHISCFDNLLSLIRSLSTKENRIFNISNIEQFCLIFIYYSIQLNRQQIFNDYYFIIFIHEFDQFPSSNRDQKWDIVCPSPFSRGYLLVFHHGLINCQNKTFHQINFKCTINFNSNETSSISYWVYSADNPQVHLIPLYYSMAYRSE